MATRRAFIGGVCGIGTGLAASSLAGCSGVAGGGSGGTASQTIQVNWWGGSDRAKRTQQVISLFEKKNTSAKVTASFSDFASYFQKLNTQAAGDGLPDVVQLGGGYVPQYMRKNQLLDLTPYTKGGKIDIKDVDKGQIDQGTVDGKIYAVTIGGNMPSIIYNKSMIRRAGMKPPGDDLSWDEFADYLGKLAKKLPSGVYGIDHQQGPVFDVWTRQRHPESYTKNYQPYFTVGDLTEYFQYWEDLRKAKINIPAEMVAAEIQNGDSNAAPIVLGKCAFATNWTNFVSQYQALMKDELGMMRCPNGGKQAGDYVQASQFFSIAATSKQPDLAASFIDFFTHDAGALKVLAVERGVPASAKARQLVTPTLSEPDKLQVEFMSANAKLVRAKSQLDPDNSAAVGDALTRAEQSISLSGVAVKQAAAAAMKDTAKALSS